MYRFTVNYLKRDGRRSRWQFVNVGFFLHGTPRLMLWCRLFGHKPVVDGVGDYRIDPESGDRVRNGHVSRWVVCDRCGVRGEPQGSLDPAVYAPDDVYHGDWNDNPPDPKTSRGFLAAKDQHRGYTPPGRIPRSSTGKLGGQLLLGLTGLGGVGWEAKVGNGGSEHTLAVSFHFGPLGALYLHTERHGLWLQRRLNPTGYESKVTGIEWREGRLTWRLWSKRDSGSRYGRDREPWWRYGELNLRLRDKLLGPRRYQYTDVVEGDTGRFVRMPEGDYLVGLQLQRRTYGRKRWFKKRSWTVDWRALGKGLPTKGPESGRVYGSGVAVSARAVRAGTWPSEACAAIVQQITGHRTSYEWEPVRRVPVDVDTGQVVPA